MYKSPIEKIYGDLRTQIVQEEENIVMNAIREVGVNVDKEELIKALQYDRNQYTTGYDDGKNEVLDKIRAKIEFEVDHRTNMLCAEDVLEIIDKYRKDQKS